MKNFHFLFISLFFILFTGINAKEIMVPSDQITKTQEIGTMATDSIRNVLAEQVVIKVNELTFDAPPATAVLKWAPSFKIDDTNDLSITVTPVSSVRHERIDRVDQMSFYSVVILVIKKVEDVETDTDKLSEYLEEIQEHLFDENLFSDQFLYDSTEEDNAYEPEKFFENSQVAGMLKVTYQVYPPVSFV